MKNKKMFQLLTLGLFVAMVVVLPLQAADGCQKKADAEKKMHAACCEKMMNAEGCMMLTQIPNLSAEQKAKLEKLHAEHQKMMAEARAAMQLKMKAHHDAVQSLLTDEQKAKIGEMGCKHMQGQGGMMQHGHGCCMKGAKAMDGKGCMEKAGQEKGECQKKAEEAKK